MVRSRTGWHVGMWWFHVVLSLGAIVYVSLFNSRLFHIIWGPINVFFRSLEPRGALTPIDFETTELLGVSKVEEFTWKQLLDLESCTRCGRCQDACPAYFSFQTICLQNIEILKNYDVKKIVTACPYCLTMFEDALKAKEVEESIKAMDLSELVAEALKTDEASG